MAHLLYIYKLFGNISWEIANYACTVPVHRSSSTTLMYSIGFDERRPHTGGYTVPVEAGFQELLGSIIKKEQNAVPFPRLEKKWAETDPILLFQTMEKTAQQLSIILYMAQPAGLLLHYWSLSSLYRPRREKRSQQGFTSLSLFSLPLKCCANGYLFLFVPSFLFRFFSVTQVPVNINSGLARSLLHSFSTHECLSARCKASRAINSGEGGESRKKALEARPGGKRTSLVCRRCLGRWDSR